MMRERFITFEGVEGCGKSTQIALLEERLRASGLEVLVTREPGGTVIAEAIRAILLDPEHENMGETAELLLYGAARAQHVHERIRPALERGAVVLCDRFADSTTAYQGAGRGLDRKTLAAIHEIATSGLEPGLTFLLDLAPEVGLERARSRGRADRLEREALAFHERVRKGYLEIAAAAPERVEVLDATQSIEAIAASIGDTVLARLGVEGQTP